jgi:hypothetical protein
MIGIKRLASTDRDFRQRLDALLAFDATQDETVEGHRRQAFSPT